MEIRNRVVAFIDVLGFKDLVSDAMAGNQTRLDQVHHAVEAVATQRDIIVRGSRPEDDVQAVAFSDSIVVSLPTKEHAAGYLGFLAASIAGWLLRRGVFCRGGVAQGRTVHTPRMLFGEGMIRAYELEEAASVPRILVADNIVEDVRSYKLVRLKQDSDGYWFINTFYELWRPMPSNAAGDVADPENEWDVGAFSVVRGAISDGLKAAKSPRLLGKYRWLAGQFDEALKESGVALPAFGIRGSKSRRGQAATAEGS